jgi:D-proline reductase (dithiol) PrdB
VSLVARHLEANGIPTVVIGCARDIVEHCGVPRFVFSDFPLGNPCGRPFDTDMQRDILEIGFKLLERAFAPRTTIQTPFRWNDDHGWKQKYLSADDQGSTGARRGPRG